MQNFECIYDNNCQSRKDDPTKCQKCSWNTRRNYVEDHFKEAKDNPIPSKCPRIHYDGPIEQSAGYKCPVCEKFTTPYEIQGTLCKHCGYRLNISGV